MYNLGRFLDDGLKLARNQSKRLEHNNWWERFLGIRYHLQQEEQGFKIFCNDFEDTKVVLHLLFFISGVLITDQVAFTIEWALQNLKASLNRLHKHIRVQV
jgi:hypothetical protein